MIAVVVNHPIQHSSGFFQYALILCESLRVVVDGGVGLLNHNLSLVLVLDLRRN